MAGRASYLVGIAVLGLVVLQIGYEVSGVPLLRGLAIAVLLVLMALAAPSVRGFPFMFLVGGFVFTSLALATLADPWDPILRGLQSSAFLVAFFCAITGVRTAAAVSPSMDRAGAYLAAQSPGRRYLALTLGAQTFSHVMSFGAIQLLGSLAVANAHADPDSAVRDVRRRRMLQAIHRGFVSAMPWSPSAFTVALTITVVPGATWEQLVVPGLVASVIIFGTGWALDRLFRPAPSSAERPRQALSGGPRALIPLLWLVGMLLSLLVVMGAVTSVRVVGLVMIIIPAMSLVWVLFQLGGVRGLRERLDDYLGKELPSYQREIVMVGSAGYLGVLGSTLLQPVFRGDHIELAAIPVWLLLVAVVWLVPLLGQIGASPVLAISLLGPLLPAPAELGITPAALAMPLVCGWAMSAMTCPLTPTTLLIGRFGGIPASAVAWQWNRGYFIATTTLLCAWSCLYAFALT